MYVIFPLLYSIWFFVIYCDSKSSEAQLSANQIENEQFENKGKRKTLTHLETILMLLHLG